MQDRETVGAVVESLASFLSSLARSPCEDPLLPGSLQVCRTFPTEPLLAGLLVKYPVEELHALSMLKWKVCAYSFSGLASCIHT